MFIKLWLKRIIKPRNLNKNLNQQEFRLNILLVFSIISFIFINLIQLINLKTGIIGHCLPGVYTFLILIFLFFLLWLSKRGEIKMATWLLIIVYSLPMFHLFILRGEDLPTGLLLAVLIIGLFGLLMEHKLTLISSGIIGFFIISFSYLQHTGLIKYNTYWRSEGGDVSDTMIYALLLFIISSIAWLSAYSLKKALARAQTSEEELQQEYKLLEIKVISRTNELYKAKEEKIIQLYRLAEFGRLSSGIFHDLINPLTAISLNLEQVTENNNNLLNTQTYLHQAVLATQRMEKMIVSIKKQIQQNSKPIFFIINEEIQQIIQILSHKARQAKVKINFISDLEIEFYGDVVKFGQIIINLIANAIEASEDKIKIENIQSTEKEIQIKLSKQRDRIIILVSDQGVGIAAKNINKIFEPFFSTKTEENRGLGLGLSSVKKITETNFLGNIAVESTENQGSKFIVSLPFTSLEN